MSPLSPAAVQSLCIWKSVTSLYASCCVPAALPNPNVLLLSSSISHSNVYYWISSCCPLCFVIICDSAWRFLLLETFLFLHSFSLCRLFFLLSHLYSCSASVEYVRLLTVGMCTKPAFRHLDCIIIPFVFSSD